MNYSPEGFKNIMERFGEDIAKEAAALCDEAVEFSHSEDWLKEQMLVLAHKALRTRN